MKTPALAFTCACFLSALALGCQKDATSTGSTASSASAVAKAAAPAASSAAVDATPGKNVEADLNALAKRWNDALSARNAEALRSVYGAKVRLYGVRLTRDQAVKQKAAALGRAADYTQSMSGSTVDQRDANHPILTFQKSWTQGGKTSSVTGSLAFAKEGGAWVVVEESDEKTDAKRAKSACEDAVMAAVFSTKEASAFLSGPTNPAGGHSSNGLHIASGPPESKTFSVGAHENHTDRFLTLMWFDVDPETGVVSQEDVATQEMTALKVEAKLTANVKTACATVRGR